MQVTPTAANVLRYAEIVRDKALLRHIAEAANEILSLASTDASDASEVLEFAERKIYALRQDRTVGGLVPVSRVVQDVYAQLSEIAMGENRIPGIPTGFQDMDERILGLNRSDLILIASRPGMGKTSLALNIACTWARRPEKPWPYFPWRWRGSSLSRPVVLRGFDSQPESADRPAEPGGMAARGGGRFRHQRNRPRIDDNPSLSVADMSAQCRRLNNLALVVIDYLQLMQSAGSGHSGANESRTQAVSDISRMLKIMAKELNVPVLCLSQLSRANEARQNKRPVLSDLRESGAIEQDADIVIGLYRDGYYNKEAVNPNLAEAIILKNRHGETGTIELVWLPEYTTYGNMEKRHDE
jgi:replicative DNA helicase